MTFYYLLFMSPKIQEYHIVPVPYTQNQQNIITPQNEIEVPLKLLPDGFEVLIMEDGAIHYYDKTTKTNTVEWMDYFDSPVKIEKGKKIIDIDREIIVRDLKDRHDYPNMLPPGKEPVYAVDIFRLSKAKDISSAAEKIGANLKVLPSTLKRYGKDFYDKSKKTVVSTFNEFGNALVGEKLKGGKFTRRLRSTKPRKKSRHLYRRS
jgi:hypothetical protein